MQTTIPPPLNHFEEALYYDHLGKPAGLDLIDPDDRNGIDDVSTGNDDDDLDEIRGIEQGEPNYKNRRI